MEGTLNERQFYIVDVDFLDPITVIPNLGSDDPMEFLMMTPKQEWSQQFVDWIKAPHTVDKEEMKEPEPESESEDDDEPEDETDKEESDSDDDDGDTDEEESSDEEDDD
ncbi:hypothetical protein SEMRO_1682_G290870.1 [Seminavis robusta]|uniref:Uncharacterized protein n=1 Tax=Seminavis robusta TaxID=568900 RepID=A0A9N8EUT3_9STRA|nr:hypothetical protein SEMRO_1682_G290870.1 [Seminavis robusta]|eukprot:Sro1682_g290870.1 n/a (109) ;mRNA; r:17523-17849